MGFWKSGAVGAMLKEVTLVIFVTGGTGLVGRDVVAAGRCRTRACPQPAESAKPAGHHVGYRRSGQAENVANRLRGREDVISCLKHW